MRAGKLRRQLILQRVTETQGATGEMTETWGDLATIWGSVEPLRGREFFAAKELNADINMRIRVRYRDDITPKMRLKDGDRIYLIEAVIDPEMRHIELQLMSREMVAV